MLLRPVVLVVPVVEKALPWKESTVFCGITITVYMSKMSMDSNTLLFNSTMHFLKGATQSQSSYSIQISLFYNLLFHELPGLFFLVGPRERERAYTKLGPQTVGSQRLLSHHCAVLNKLYNGKQAAVGSI